MAAGTDPRCHRSPAGRNLLTFTDFEGVDPEAFEDGSAEVLFRQEYYNLPPMRSFLLSVKVDF